jgi:hypothetical protein
MPNLDAEAVAEWLTERDPDAATAWLPPMTSLREDTASLLRQLGGALDAAQAHEPEALSRQLQEKPQSERLSTVLVHIDRPTRMRLLSWLGEPPMPRPDLVIRTCLGDDSAPAGGVLRREMRQICCTALLSRVFEHGRVMQLLDACRQAGLSGEAA